MIDRFPEWSRGAPGFTLYEFADGRWGWHFKDASGNIIESASFPYPDRDTASRFCSTYWRLAGEALMKLCAP